MGTQEEDKQEVPETFRVPAFRWGIAFISAGIIVAIALLFIEDTLVQTVALAVAAVDLVTTPKILEMVAEENNKKALLRSFVYSPTCVARSTTSSLYISASSSCWSGRFS